MDCRAKFDKETVARAHRKPKWLPHQSAPTDSGCTHDNQDVHDAQALLRHTYSRLRLKLQLLAFGH